MTQQPAFQIDQLVWAKVEPYPWWPGRIVQTRNNNIYKITFFGDPSYCYLNADSLKNFQAVYPQPQNIHEITQQVFKAIEIAKRIHKKSKQKSAISSSTQPLSLQYGQKNVSKLNENKMYSNQQSSIFQQKSESENLSQLKVSQLKVNNNKQYEQILSTEITTDNVVQLLNSNTVLKLQNCKGYAQRKYAIQFIKKLEVTVLKKYRLYQFESKQQTIIQSTQVKPRIKPHHASNMIKNICCRKIYYILKQKSLQIKNAHRISLHIVNRLQSMNGGFDTEDFQREMINLLIWLKDASVQKIMDIQENIPIHKTINSKSEDNSSKTTQTSLME